MQKDHEFCLRCGRKLKNPVAREKGYGATCEKKLSTSLAHKLFNSGISGISENATHLQSS